MYPKDTEKWKQFTTGATVSPISYLLFCIPKILKNESNSQLFGIMELIEKGCFVSQRYWKMKAIHNKKYVHLFSGLVVLYPKDTEKWKQFTTVQVTEVKEYALFCIPKILKNESNSQHQFYSVRNSVSCFVSQRYWKMKAIHNIRIRFEKWIDVVLYPKDTEKWKQFTTLNSSL